MFVKANIKEFLKMTEADRAVLEPRLTPLKQRLLVSHYLRDHPSKAALVKYYRPFVAELSNLARVHAYGCPREDCPSFYDVDAMLSLVQKFELEKHLREAWTGVLTQPEKLSIERECGATEEECVLWGVQCTAQVIELGLSFALEKSVDGKQGLYNEIKNEYNPAPCYDHIDTGYIVHYKGIALPKHTYVFADEGQDMNKLDCMTVEGLVKPNGGILVADDDSQTLFSFAGANKVCAHMHCGKWVEVEVGACSPSPHTSSGRTHAAAVRRAGVPKRGQLLPGSRSREGGTDGAERHGS